MAKTPQGFKTRLEPQDEYPHDPGDAKNYNESMYFNVFDPAKNAVDIRFHDENDRVFHRAAYRRRASTGWT